MTLQASPPADAPAVPGAVAAPSDRSLVVTSAALLVAVVAGVVGTLQADLSRAGQYGLLDALEWPTYLSLAALAVGLATELTRERLRQVPLTLLVVTLVVVLFSLPNVADSAASFPTGYLHVGFASYITEHGAVPLHYDARFSWPGFFAAVSTITTWAGLEDARALLRWAPVAFELLALPGLVLLTRSVSPRPRTAWFAVVLFYCGVWFGQDYFSPQATAFVLYVSMLAVLFWLAQERRVEPERLRRRRRRLRRLFPRTPPAPVPGVRGWRSLGVEASLVLVMAGMVVEHQLTPVSTVVALALFAALRMTRYRLLWLLAALVFVAWFSYGARDYWSGHLQVLFGDVGQVSSTAKSGVGERVAGDPQYVRMQYLRLALSAGFLFLAGIGAVRMRRSPMVALLACLALAPFGLILVQSYGGEVFMRCFLYAMPFLAVLSAHALAPLLKLPRPLALPAVGIVVLGFSVVLLAAKGSNVAFERITQSQVEAAEFVTATAPPGASVGILAPVSPLGYSGVGDRKILDLAGYPGCLTSVAPCVEGSKPDFVFLSGSQEQFGRLRSGLPEGWLMRTGLDALVSSGKYRVVFRGGDAVVLRRVGS